MQRAKRITFGVFHHRIQPPLLPFPFINITPIVRNTPKRQACRKNEAKGILLAAIGMLARHSI